MEQKYFIFKMSVQPDKNRNFFLFQILIDVKKEKKFTKEEKEIEK